ncbi:DUF4838 domain-containing protein [Paenibacillus ginsengarvi]|uniref:DUF4838 domain-containing protein n=1 Tax=Paenibacillus ginsengarvi TaxID=400777 RepID=A0A3B0CP67_9BACL|nr:DUF4838 domain-containing protein [Paenibacillus ginsengarvi]RKN86154.1 DUF4838 domain-containing protein [Paenibacillus ginsengarvi]
MMANENTSSYYLVKEGKAQAVIIRSAGNLGQEAVKEFQADILRATGAALPIVDADELRNVPEGFVYVQIGPGPLMEDESGNEGTANQVQETYRIVSKGNRLLFSGGSNDAILWAVAYFLDRHMGVRWLWPGDLGTFVPRTDSIALPELDITSRPELEMRQLRVRKSAPPEGHHWLRLHGMGSRTTYAFGHAFTKWWDKYGEEHPDYFAYPPEGQQQVQPGRIKLDISNEAVDEAIIREWREAGTPANWNVSPNDGSGFCVSPGCLAMDVPQGQSVTAIWRAEGQLTARYVKFWNRLIDKMRAIRPDVTLTTFAYSCYKSPPPPGITLKDGFVLQIVGFYNDYEQWKGWFDAGAKLFLRPNWWHSGAISPNLPLHAQGEFFKFAERRGMLGFDFDTMFGYWGTQGPNYYLIARLSARPDLSVDDVIAEYTSAFGKAAPAIQDYLGYWERFSEEAGFNIQLYPKGRYEALAAQFDLPRSTLNGGWYILPYLMTDDVLNEARAILNRAEELASGEGEAGARVAFLRDGLKHVEWTREVVRYGYEKSRPSGATKNEFIRLRERLDAFRKELSERHVIWLGTLNEFEQLRGIPTHESRTTGWDEQTSSGPGGKEMDEQVLGM